MRRAALRRLAELGVDGRRAEVLLNSEPDRGDRWMAYMALAPAIVVGDLIGPHGGHRDLRL